MKTPKEILELHISKMLKKTKQSHITIEEVRNLPEYVSAINAIKQAQKEAWDEAVDKCKKYANTKVGGYLGGISIMIIDEDSILKVKEMFKSE
jgi:hypothetical protein